MFSSLSKSLASLYNSTSSVSLSPKSILASYLSKSLAEFFNVDSDSVETNLIHDAHVLLQNVEIKPRIHVADSNVCTAVLLSGSVDSIEFSWTWGSGAGEGAAAYIRDVRLTVKGVKINLSPCSKEEVSEILESDESESSSVPTTPSSESETAAGGSDWKARYIQQILDHLTLIVTDIEIVINLPSPEETAVILQGSQIELVTLGKLAEGESTQGLRQRMCVGSISALVRQQTSQDAGTVDFPLLDPFGYRAIVKRISGRRFLDGITKGIIVQGENILGASDSTGSVKQAKNAIRVHANRVQVKALLKLQEMIGIVGDDSASSSTEEDTKDSLEKTSDSNAARFILPIQSMCLVLCDMTEIRLDGCTVRYRADGSELSVDCVSGCLLVDDELITEEGLGVWTLDLLTRELRIDPVEADESSYFHDAKAQLGAESSDIVARFNWEMDQSQKIVNGFYNLLDLWGNDTDTSSNAGWSLNVNGKATFHLKGAEQRWLEVSVDSVKVTTRSKNKPTAAEDDFQSPPYLLEWATIVVGPCSFGEVTVCVPHAKSTLDGSALQIEGAVNGTFESADVMMNLKQIFNEACDLFQGESSGVPFQVNVPQAQLSILEPQLMSIRVDNVQGHGLVWKCAQVNATGTASGLSLQASTIEATLESQIKTVKIDELSTFCVPGVGYLSSPIHNTVIKLNENVLCIDFMDVEMMYEAESPIASDSKDGAVSIQADWIRSPYDIKLFSRSFVMRKGKTIDGENHFVRCADIEAYLKMGPLHSVPDLLLQLQCASLEVSHTMLDACFKGLSVRMAIEQMGSDSVNERVESLFCLSGLGKLSCDSWLRVDQISTLSVPSVGRLFEPAQGVLVSLVEDILVVELNSVSWQALDFSKEKDGDETERGETSSPLLAFPLCLRLKCLTIMKEFAVGKPGVRCDNIECVFRPSTSSTKECSVNSTKVDFVCGYVQARGSERNELAIKGITTEILLEHDSKALSNNLASAPVIVPGVGCLSSAEMKVEKIAKLSIAGVGALKSAVLESKIRFQSGILDCECKQVEWALDQSIVSEKARDTKTEVEAGFDVLFPVKFAVESLVVTNKSSQDRCHVGMLNANIMPAAAVSDGHSGWIHLNCSSLQAGGKYFCSISDVIVESTLERSLLESTQANPLLPDLPGLGVVSATKIMLAEVTTAGVANTGQVVAPVQSVIVQVVGDSLKFECPSLAVELAGVSTGQDQVLNGTNSEKIDLIVPCPIRIDLKEFSVVQKETPGRSAQWAACTDLEMDVKAAPEGHIYLLASTIKGGSIGCAEIEFESISVLSTLQSLSSASEGSAPLCIPGVGCLSHASIEVGNVSTLKVHGMGSCMTPVRSTSLEFDNGTLTVRCSSIELQREEKLGGNLSDMSPVSASVLPCPVQLNLESFAIHDSGSLSRLSGLELYIKPVSTEGYPNEENAGCIRLECAQLCSKSPSNVAIDAYTLNFEANLWPVGTDRGFLDVTGVGTIHEATMKVSEISALSVPGYILSSPIRNPAIQFNGGILFLKLACLDLIKTPPVVTGAMVNRNTAQGMARLPIPIHMNVNDVAVKTVTQGGKTSDWLTCQRVSVLLEPTSHTIPHESSSGRDLSPMTMVKVVQASGVTCMEMLRLPLVNASALVDFNRMDTLQNLNVEAETVELTADFSNDSWSEALVTSGETEALMLPFAKIQELDLTLNFTTRRKIVSIDNAVLHCAAFYGDKTTDSSSVGGHYIEIVKRRLPFLLSKANVMGANVGDNVGMYAASAAMSSSVIGSVVGIGARDAIGGAISSGKLVRDAAETDSYRFGDFTRGVVASAKSAAKSGARMRGDDEYMVGDLTAGASAATAEYASKNRVRLSAAGGSGLGMVAGMAVAGPIGLVAGSILGGKVAGSAAKKTLGEGEALNEAKTTGRLVDDRREPCTPSASTAGQPPDLLSGTIGDTGVESNYPGRQAHHSPANSVAAQSHPDIQDPFDVFNSSAPVAGSHAPQPASHSVPFSEDLLDPVTTTHHSIATRNSPPTSSPTHRPATQRPDALSSQHHSPLPQSSAGHHTQTFASNQQSKEEKAGYRFGDVTRGMIARGKQRRGGDEKSGYKFGDFSRGLFG